MSITIIFSGPAANASQAKNSIVGAGSNVLPTDHNWGFPDSKIVDWTGERNEDESIIEDSGEWVPREAEYPTVFITAECSEGILNDIVKSAQRFGFVPRAHWSNPDEVEKTPERVA